MKLTPRSCCIWAFLMLFSLNAVVAQSDEALLRDLAEENKKSVEALVLYPSETRLAILEATKHPEVLIKMQDMREKTSAAFHTLIEDFPRSTQAVFYDLNRYPGLVGLLVSQKNDAAALRKALEVLPEGKRDEAFGVATRQMPTLARINDLNQTTGRAFERMIAGYPASAKQAFEHLLGLPEVIDLLNEDLRFTILVGETYRDNPAMVIQQTDSLSLAVARSHAEELENWKADIENDPEAKKELESAARDYATENGYFYEDYDDVFYDPYNYTVVHHYYQPYPYWYGYPYWEPFPRWHPYPWWWDWGCHFHPYGVVVVYLPSYHFMHWYFGHPYHHYHYNHLSSHFVNHYYGHRNSGTTISSGVREWHNRNRTVISEELLADKNRLPERLAAYGRFEQGREEFNKKNPQKPASPEEFLEKNTRKYPELERSRESAKTEMELENEAIREKRRDWAPPKAPSKPEPAPAPKTERPPRSKPNPPRIPPDTDKPDYNDPTPTIRPRTQPDEAKDYHRQKVEERKPRQETQRSNPPPAPNPQKSNPPKTRKRN